MSKKLLLLINAILVSSAVSATELESSINGFAYYRAFSDKNWQVDDSKIAANFFVGYGQLSASAQISESMDDTEETTKRAFISLETPVSKNSHFHWDYGRIPALTSFYNNATDAPGTSGMSMLPLAGYNHRMNNGMFTLLDGGRIRFDTVVSRTEIISLQYIRGTMFIESQDKIQHEAFNAPFRTDIRVTTDKRPSSSLSFRYENDNLIWFISRNEYTAGVEAVENNPVAKFLASNYVKFDYVLSKYGVRVSNNDYFIQAEYNVGETSAHSTSNKRTADMTAYDSHVILGMYIMRCTNVYAGMSYGTSNQGKNGAIDRFVGITRDEGDFVYSLDYHNGSGRAWMKYNADTPFEWEAVSAAITYRFQ